MKVHYQSLVLCATSELRSSVLYYLYVKEFSDYSINAKITLDQETQGHQLLTCCFCLQ